MEIEVKYGFKDKGTITHLLVDGNGFSVVFTSTAANGDERKEVKLLINRVQHYVRNVIERGVILIFGTDKGYDVRFLRIQLLEWNIFSWIIRRKKVGESVKRAYVILKRVGWKIEHTISWLQRKFRRVSMRWERKVCYWEGFLTFGFIVFWIDQLVG